MADKRGRRPDISPLLEQTLRRGELGPEWIREQARNSAKRRFDVESFLARTGAEREAKLGESTGLGDLLTFLPAASAAKALRAREFLPAGVNALAFTSQFDDSKLGRTVGDLTAAFPVFGVGATGRLRQAGERMAKTGKDLPLFSYEGKIAPARQRELETRMRNWIPKLSSKDPGKAMAELDEFVSRNPFWGKYPLEKGPLLDYLPSSLRPAFYQSLKEQGYGGIKMGSRDLGALRPDFRPGKETIKPFSSRSWEDILKYEQGGGVPSGWAAANEGRSAPWFTRPGESTPAGQRNFLEDRALGAGAGQQIDPRAKAFLEQMAIGSGIGTAANLATGGIPGIGEDQRAGLVVNSRNIGRLSQAYRSNLDRLNQIRPESRYLNKLEAAYAAKYPKLYERAIPPGYHPVDVLPVPDPNAFRGSFDPIDFGIRLKLPENSSTAWKSSENRQTGAAILAHEFQHAVDMSRVPSGLRTPLMPKGKTIEFNDFLPKGTRHSVKDIAKVWAELPTSKGRSDLGAIVENSRGPARYTTYREALAAGDPYLYGDQPIEWRAYKAGDTAAKTLGKLFENMSNSKVKGAGALGAAAVLAGIPSDSDPNSADSQAGLIVNKRNLGRLAQLQAAAHDRLERIRPAFPELNYLESVFAAKYPKIYEKSVGASPKGAFMLGLDGTSSGSFSPFTGRITVGTPNSSAGWAKPSAIPAIFNTMGHESLHGLDFQRLGKVNHPITGRRLDLGDFISPEATARPREMRDLVDNLKRFYPNADNMLKTLKPKYTLPGSEDDSFFTRLKGDIGYHMNPIEIRANRAGKTSAKTLSNLMDKLISLEE